MTASYHQSSLDPSLIFLTEHSSLLRVDVETAEALRRGDESGIEPWLGVLVAPNEMRRRTPNALSLNIATSCNLGCTYCYADSGRFGGENRPAMSTGTMRAAVDNLLEGNRDGRATVGFIGGEPFANRRLLHETVAYAEDKARATNVTIAFSVTTNGTLLQAEDIELLRSRSFAVTISIDGPARLHDQVRPGLGFQRSYDRTIARIRPLLDDPRSCRISARATITRLHIDVSEIIEHLCDIGFREVGVAPLQTAPRHDLVFQEDDFTVLLGSMREAARQEFDRLVRGYPPRFTNLIVGMREIQRGARRSLPCGAADNYVSVSAEGNYFACHRTIDDDRFRLGNVGSGIDEEARETFISSHRVEEQPAAVTGGQLRHRGRRDRGDRVLERQ